MGGLQAMRLAAKRLKEEAARTAESCIEHAGANAVCARVRYSYQNVRHAIRGPIRTAGRGAGADLAATKQLAFEDLGLIRAAAEGQATRLGELHAMKKEAKRLQEAANALHGGIESAGATALCARIQYKDESGRHTIRGPVRTAERRVEADLAAMRDAAQTSTSGAQQLSAIKAVVQCLQERAKMEARVAVGVDQYEAVRQAHKVDDSDPESDSSDDAD